MASSRFVPPETTLEAFIEEQANKNTLNKTKRDVSLLKEVMRMNGKEEEFENIEPRGLDEILCAFILAVKKKDGEEYEPTTLRSFVSSFDRSLRKKDYPTAIIEGQEFRKTRETLVSKQKEFKKAGKGNKTKAARALTNEEVDVLNNKELLDVSSPESLLNTLWLNNTQHLGLRGCQEHRNMRWGDVQLQTSADGTEFLERQQKPERALNRNTTLQINQKCFLSQGVTEVH